MSEPTVEPNPAAKSAEAKHKPHAGLRQTLDALICLAVAVILVRTFQAEGYMISTGSMAPTLPGFHKRVECPSCGFHFAVGAASPRDLDFEENGVSVLLSRRAFAFAGGSREETPDEPIDESQATTAVCPNCGRDSIDLANIPRNQGDQLLVHKSAFDYVAPRRWEVAVFRNPRRTTQAYVKRIAGLPGETVDIVNGDVTINGEIERKPLSRQKAMRIVVYDHDYEPQGDPGWEPRWRPEVGESAWRRAGRGFERKVEARFGSATKALEWVRYRHWLRGGGDHTTVVRIPESLREHDLSNPSLFPLRHDDHAGTLSHSGVLSARARDRIARTIDDPEFVRLIHELYEKAHIAPITDDYGYNRVHIGYRPVPVRDLMFSARVTIQSGHGKFAVEMTDGRRTFRFTLDAATRDISLVVDGDKTPARKARLKGGVIDSPFDLEMSLFDRQVIVAINGQPLFAPLLLKEIPRTAPHSRRPVRFGASDLNLRVDALRIYRDVHYTDKGEEGLFVLGEDEFFVLGDNSPVSADSRVWKHNGVHRRLFLGKPLFVHLPSKPGKLRIGGTSIHFRIPDFSRMRYIR